ncbi:unnamed protein product [Effrenium voratum]|uniref:Uncharacterized protein n=1 Tax=Effrenium voratum TaxID=2562239 RepID=A0AA36N059_9DINO|nr:unnamed protein product [Effrenium voratum]
MRYLPLPCRHISSILIGKDLATTSLKEVRSELEQRLNLSPGSLDGEKEKLKHMVAAQIQKIQETAPSRRSKGRRKERAQRNAAQWTILPQEAQEAQEAQVQEAEPGKASGKGAKGAKGPSTKERQRTSMTRKEFMKKAKAITVQIGDKKLKATPKQFSTGSSGFMASTKVVIEVDGVPLTLQCGLNLPVIGSKEWRD